MKQLRGDDWLYRVTRRKVKRLLLLLSEQEYQPRQMANGNVDGRPQARSQ